MFEWLFRKSNFQLFQDSYALTFDSMLAGLLDALSARIEKGDTVFLLTHFQDSFLKMQSRLEKAGIGYSIIAEPVDSSVITRLADSSSNCVHLSMAQMLLSESPSGEKKQQPHVSVVVCERHPMPAYDQAVAGWCRELPFPVELGYLLSLDDPTVSYVITDSVRRLLEQFGMGENELITSSMVSKRLSSVLRRKASKITEEVSADSASEWLELNYPS